MLIELLQEYGLTGVAFGALLTLMMSQNKAAAVRISKLEKEQHETHVTHLADQKAMIQEYVELVRSKTQVLASLTGCLEAIKDTLSRMERDQRR